MLQRTLEVLFWSPRRNTLMFKTATPSGPGGSRTWYAASSNSMVGAAQTAGKRRHHLSPDFYRSKAFRAAGVSQGWMWMRVRQTPT